MMHVQRIDPFEWGIFRVFENKQNVTQFYWQLLCDWGNKMRRSNPIRLP